MKKNKKVLKFGTYTNNGLSMGLRELGEDVILEMREILEQDRKSLEFDLKSSLRRLDKFIKDVLGPIPPNEKFYTWFMEHQHISNWGANLPNFTDEEIIDCAIEYNEELKSHIKNKLEISDTLEWQKSKQVRRIFVDLLVENKLISEQDAHSFTALFTDNKRQTKVNWNHTRTLLVYLIMRLEQEGFISSRFRSGHFIENNFLANGKLVSNIKQAKNNLKSSNTGKPKNHHLVDSIFEALPS